MACEYINLAKFIDRTLTEVKKKNNRHKEYLLMIAFDGDCISPFNNVDYFNTRTANRSNYIFATLYLKVVSEHALVQNFRIN